MTKLLLLATALIALNAQNAQAGDSIHKEMLGGWCATGQVTYTDNDTWSHSTYRRSTRRACGEGDWLQLRARGYVLHSGEDVVCRFVSVRAAWTRGRDQLLLVTTKCQAEESAWHDDTMIFTLSGGALTGSVKVQTD